MKRGSGYVLRGRSPRRLALKTAPSNSPLALVREGYKDEEDGGIWKLQAIGNGLLISVRHTPCLIEGEERMNPGHKKVKRLFKKKERERRREFIIEGIRAVREFLEQGGKIKAAFYSQTLLDTPAGMNLIRDLKKRKLPVRLTGKKEFKEISGTITPQGLLAVAEKPEYKLQALLKREGVVLVLDRIQDPGNLGTIIRTAEASGAAGVILSSGSADPYNPKVVRASAGAVTCLPVLRNQPIREIIKRLKKRGFRVYAATPGEGKPYDRVRFASLTALLLGNEAKGIDRSILSLSDEKVSIPLYGKTESINVSVAAGILLYWIKQGLRKRAVRTINGSEAVY